ncbi:hypothetical protein JCM17823_04010 [Halorubrum gandharaense]
MDVLGDLLARDRRTRDIAVETADGRERSYHQLITNAYKAANVCRHLGVRAGATVAVVPVPGLHPLLAFLGAAGLGAHVRFDPATGIEAGDRLVVAPVADEPALSPPPGTNLAVFGGPPEQAETTHWEQELWSENPGMPPAGTTPDDPALVGADGTEHAHGAVLDAAGNVAAEYDIGPESRVVLRTTFADPRAVVAGVVAPLSVGGASVLAGAAPPNPDDERRGDLAVVDDRGEQGGTPASVPEPQRLRPSEVPL